MVGFAAPAVGSGTLRGVSLGAAAFVDDELELLLLELDELELLLELLSLSPPQAPSVMLRHTAAATAMTGRCDICIVTPQG
ncbi:hypothetical protein MAUB_34500 [Mycolicibacterium aubagnense]|uniref:Uncharacterized protein n=1 Tax=Mycolicibacterium aubagnense TaxID=319707 RepID=A0ABM7IFQ9_9MYCO|nr:hypothetical protein MAUB_34500 [Mycolicibacterium aubagnense]